MVRLKESKLLLTILVRAFQFLMVRLKGNWVDNLPSGNWISIPYGAIKRAPVNSPKIAKWSFQFLMVRLKVFVAKNGHTLLVHFNSLWCD